MGARADADGGPRDRADRDQDHRRHGAGRPAFPDRYPRALYPTDRRRDARRQDRSRRPLAQGPSHDAARGDLPRWRWRSGRIRATRSWAAARRRGTRCRTGRRSAPAASAAARSCLHVRADLQVVDLRGNVDTRLAKLDRNEEWSAVILAAAGLSRLGLGGRISQRLPPEVMLPAPGQGALAVDRAATTTRRRQRRCGARYTMRRPRWRCWPSAASCALLEGGCQVPVAALAAVSDGRRAAARAGGGAPRGARGRGDRDGERARRAVGGGGGRWHWPSGCSTTAPTRSWRRCAPNRRRRCRSPDARHGRGHRLGRNIPGSPRGVARAAGGGGGVPADGVRAAARLASGGPGARPAPRVRRGGGHQSEGGRGRSPGGWRRAG